MQRVHTEQVQAIERAHAEQCAQLCAEHAAQMKQSEAEMQALKASCEEQASTCAAQLQTLEELRKLHSAHTQQMQALEIAHAEHLQKLEKRVTEPQEAEAEQLKQLTAQLQGLQRQQEQQSVLDSQRLAAHSQAQGLAEQSWQKVRELEQQHQTALEQLGKQLQSLEASSKAQAAQLQQMQHLHANPEHTEAICQLASCDKPVYVETGLDGRVHGYCGRAHARQDGALNDEVEAPVLKLEASRLRRHEKILGNKELEFADPPRISPGSFTTPPAFSGGRGGQLTRPSASWTHPSQSSRNRDFAYEQEKIQGNERRPSPGSTY